MNHFYLIKLKESEEEEYDANEYPQRVGRQKHILDINFQFNDSRRGVGGRGRGNRSGPRGGNRGNRGDRQGNKFRGGNNEEQVIFASMQFLCFKGHTIFYF